MPLKYVDPNRRPTVAERTMNSIARSRVGQVLAKRVARKTDPWLQRVTNHRVSWGMFNVPSATLKTTGAKTGQPRQSQVAYFNDASDVILVASNYGGDRHPNWYYNLIAHPDCEFGGEYFHATEVTDPAEHSRLYGLAERYYPGFTDYKAKTAEIGRTIPVFRLSPISP
jgi:deazaflavin-dependent oxidoreductase (nitroreductase family)